MALRVWAFKGLGRAFRIMDDNGDKKISFPEFQKGLNDYGVYLDTREVRHIARKRST